MLANSRRQGYGGAYTLTVANAGPDAAADVTISDNLPRAIAEAAVRRSGDERDTRAVTCTIGALASGANAIRTITVQTTSANGSLHNTASVSSSTGDPDAPDDRTATATTTVNPAASLALTMTDTTDPADRLVVGSPPVAVGRRGTAVVPTATSYESRSSRAADALDVLNARGRIDA